MIERWVLRWTTTTFRTAVLENLNCSVEPIAFCAFREDLVCVPVRPEHDGHDGVDVALPLNAGSSSVDVKRARAEHFIGFPRTINGGRRKFIIHRADGAQQGSAFLRFQRSG
jgi:hypothetical protein